MLARISLVTLALISFSDIARAQTRPEPDDDAEIPAATSPEKKQVIVNVPPPAPVSASRNEIDDLRARIAALEAARDEKIDATKSVAAPAPPPPPPAATASPFSLSRIPSPNAFADSPWSRVFSQGLSIGGYIQTQYQTNQMSEDQLDANGVPLNQDRFVLRRARLRVEEGWKFAHATIEVDGNNVSGLAFGLRRAEASLYYPGKNTANGEGSEGVPLVALTAGLTDIPFGYELMEPNRSRIFLERTTASRAFFPGDADFGARLFGGLSWFRWAIGLSNGEPIPDSDPSAIGFDPTSAKDVMARVGAEAKAASFLDVSAGASFVRGTGFHAGTEATKATLTWKDLNENGVVDAGEVSGVPGRAATPSQNFSRWLLGLDLVLRVKTPIGRGLFAAEGYIAQNYDRGLFVADPVTTGIDLREIGFYASYVQEIKEYGLVGLRVDTYDPNGDATQSRAGSVLPSNQSITTVSPLIGLAWPGRARLVLQYDRVFDHEGLDARGVPTDLKNDQWTLRLQVEL